MKEKISLSIIKVDLKSLRASVFPPICKKDILKDVKNNQYISFATVKADDKPGFFLYIFNMEAMHPKHPRYVRVCYIHNSVVEHQPQISFQEYLEMQDNEFSQEILNIEPNFFR